MGTELDNNTTLINHSKAEIKQIVPARGWEAVYNVKGTKGKKQTYCEVVVWALCIQGGRTIVRGMVPSETSGELPGSNLGFCDERKSFVGLVYRNNK